MSNSLDVRKFLLQGDSAPTSRSSLVPAQRSDEPSRISMDQVRRARIAVASRAHDWEDCLTLLKMLGLDLAEGDRPTVCR